MQINRQAGGSEAPPRRDLRQGSRRSAMSRLRDRIDSLLAAVTFAEEGEVEVARRFVAEARRPRALRR